MALLTVENAKDLLKRGRDDDLTEVQDSLWLDWINYINNFLYRKLIQLNPELYLSETTITVVSGTASYSLPADFRSINVLGSGVYTTDSNDEITNTRLIKTAKGSGSIGIWIDQKNSLVYFTPKPTTSNLYKLRYIPALTMLTSNSDSLLLDDEYSEYLTRALELAYDIWNNDKNSEVFADQRFARALDEIIENISIENDTFSTGDYVIVY